MHYEATYLGPYGSISTGWRRLEYGQPSLIVASEMERLLRENPEWVLIVTEGDRKLVHRGARLSPPKPLLTAPLPLVPPVAAAPPPPPSAQLAPVVEAVATVEEEEADVDFDAPPSAPTISVEQIRAAAPQLAAQDADDVAAMLTLPDVTAADLRRYGGVSAAAAKRLLALRETVP